MEEVRILWVKDPCDRKKSTSEALVTDKNRLTVGLPHFRGESGGAHVMVELTRFVRVMIDMANKVCNKKDPLVERRVYMRSESFPKISTGILDNENGRVREGVVRANEERGKSARAAGRGPRVTKTVRS